MLKGCSCESYSAPVVSELGSYLCSFFRHDLMRPSQARLLYFKCLGGVFGSPLTRSALRRAINYNKIFISPRLARSKVFTLESFQCNCRNRWCFFQNQFVSGVVLKLQDPIRIREFDEMILCLNFQNCLYGSV